MAERITGIVPAEPGWRAIFGEEPGETARSRIVGWGVLAEEDGERVVGLIVDPQHPARVVPATEAVSPDAGPFTRYGFVGS